jgi:hypothetical protein
MTLDHRSGNSRIFGTSFKFKNRSGFLAQASRASGACEAKRPRRGPGLSLAAPARQEGGRTGTDGWTSSSMLGSTHKAVEHPGQLSSEEAV